MAVLIIEQATLAIIIGLLAAIVFSLKILFKLERRIFNIDQNIAKIAGDVMAEELKLERALIGKTGVKAKKKTAKKSVKKTVKKVKKKSVKKQVKITKRPKTKKTRKRR